MAEASRAVTKTAHAAKREDELVEHRALFSRRRMTSQCTLLTSASMNSDYTYLPQRAVISLPGPDTIALLERLVTNATTDWSSGETRYGALLTPQGKIIADYLALRTQDGVLLDVARAHAADLAKRLKMFRLRSQVEIELRQDLHVVAGTGPAASSVDNAAFTYQDPRYRDGRPRALIEGPAPDVQPDAFADYHADRIASVIPEQDADFGSAAVFPAEINMDVLGGVALNKGCFVGQEVVSRMHRRGKIRKRTLSIEFPDGLTVQPGDEIMAPLPIGVVTSVSGTRALALVRTDRLLAAERAGETPTLHETPVRLEKRAWLEAELARMEER